MDMPPIRIPGDFLVMQGIVGADALVNTLDPPADLEDLVRAQVRTSGSNQSNHHSLPTTSRQVTAEGSQNRLDSLPAPIQTSFERWRARARHDSLHEWQAWKSKLSRQDFHQSEVEECWWRNPQTGCLASFDEIPSLPNNDVGQTVIRPTGSLAPGTAVRGLEIYAVAHSMPSSATTTTQRLLPIAGKRKLFPWNRQTGSAGEVLVMKYETRPRRESDHKQTGYCVYSIDGYSFLYPGSLDDYANLYMKRWYWKVVGSSGLDVFCNSPDSQAPPNKVLIPYGSTLEVLGRKFDERTGEKRLSVSVFLWDTTPGYRKIEGWCRESNDKGDAVVQPLPCAVPVLFQVIARLGEHLTTDLDTRSRPHLVAPYHSWITVTHRAFTDRPNKAGEFPERLRTAGCGWISRKVDREGTISSVVRTESWDSWFDPDTPEVFHYLFQRNFISKIDKVKKKKKKKEGGIPLDIVINLNDDKHNSDIDDDGASLLETFRST